MARFSFMCFYLLVPVFAICQFLKNGMFLCNGILNQEYFKGKTVRSFSYETTSKLFLKNVYILCVFLIALLYLPFGGTPLLL